MSRLLCRVIAALIFFIRGASAEDFGRNGYWQQRVDYKIDVTLSNDGRTIDGTESFTYFNNSPDTLNVLYLKAFPNSARKGSLMDRQARQLEDYSIANSNNSQWGSLVVSHVSYGRGRNIDMTLDDTIYELRLYDPLAPGDSAEITLRFVTRLPVGIGSRHGLIEGQSKAAYWYPQVCVYDRKFGWVNAQYIGRGECYGDYGDFTVAITASADRVVVATGILTNRGEVLPPALRDSLDITQFQKPKTAWPTIAVDTIHTKTWRFRAENVNDFAWVAGKDFCIDEGEYYGVPIEIYAKRSNAKAWKTALQYAQEDITSYGEWCGKYAWPVVKVTDSYDGMEYPMLAFCSSGEPSARFPLLIYHEIGHFWFMGIIGSNQVDRACLDEGFNTHVEIATMEKYHGRAGNIDNFDNWYERAFYPHDEDRDNRGLRQYITWAKAGYDLPMIISSDNASEYWAYRVSSYYKVVSMHFALRTIYGDSLYWRALREYGERWRFKHPYEEDFVESFSTTVGEKVSQYFDQWFTSRRQIDYSFVRSKRVNADTFAITIARPGDFVSPIDIAVISHAGDTTFYTVNPEGHEFVKPGYHATPVWRQYRQPAFQHTISIICPHGVKRVVIDPRNMLADVNRLNNASGILPPTETKFDAMFHDVPSLHAYSLRLRPDCWYDDVNGIALGGHAQGSYIRTTNKFSLDLGYLTRSDKMYIDGKYSTPFQPLGNLAFFEARFLKSGDKYFATYGGRKVYKPTWSRNSFLEGRVSTSVLHTPDSAYRQVFQNSYQKSETDVAWVELKTTSAHNSRFISFTQTSQLQYAYQPSDSYAHAFNQKSSAVALEVKSKSGISVKLDAKLFSSGGVIVPDMFLYHLTRARAYESLIDSRIFREQGTFPREWSGDIYLNDGGLRGYQDRSLYGVEGARYSAAILNMPVLRTMKLEKLPFTKGFLGNVLTDIFLDYCWIGWSNYSALSEPYGTFLAGTKRHYYTSSGISFTTPSLWNGQRLRVDFPVYLSDPKSDEDKWEFRVSAAWILPIQEEFPESR